MKSRLLLAFCLIAGLPLFAQINNRLVLDYFDKKCEGNHERLSDYLSAKIADQYTDAGSGITHIYLQQHYQNIPINNAICNIAIKNGVLVYQNDRFELMLRKKVNATKPLITALQAYESTLSHLELSREGNLQLKTENNNDQVFVYENNSIASSPIQIRLLYTKVDSTLRLSWEVSFELKNQPHWWNTRVDALTGKILEKNDFVLSCSFDHDHETDNDMPAPPPPPPAVPTTSFRAFPLPLEAPSFGSSLLLTDPADSVASPYTWLDTNGVTGNEFTITRGNNVHAYEDANADNAPGYSPNSSTLVFDYPYVNNAVPLTNQDAALTNLFYVNNRIHDLLYTAGFTELAGNFQKNNYGKGGLGNDYVQAEGLDGSGTNNANFATPADGSAPRMQMYLWSGNASSCSNLNVNAAPYISGNLNIGLAAFAVNASATDTVVLAIDGTAPVNDGCSAISNVSGKIALIDRGTCNFGTKALNAQSAGAVGVIIANNVAGAPPALGGTAPGLTIPVVSISQADGNSIKTALTNGTTVTATLNTCVANQIDGDFDNGIIVHEYGHGVSNRLTGGPSQAGCLSNAEQGGEGWSDWLALIATIENGDSANDARGIGTYALGQNTGALGIRRYPYSFDMNINPQTYGDLAANTEVHAIGEIWCDALWDMTWLLIDNLGFDANPYNANAGNNIALKLVLEGMKLQPCNPGYIDARNAILQADLLLYNNAHRCLIWQAFARRGMGVNASQGSASTVGDETEDFALPYFCLAPTAIPSAAFTANVTTVSCGGTVTFTDQSVQAFDWKWYFGDGDTSLLQSPSHIYTSPGLYTVKLVVSNPLGLDSEVLISYINVTPAFSTTLTAISDSICKGDTVRIAANSSGSTNLYYMAQPITFAPLSTTGTNVTLADDAYSAALPIGFTFNFYGNNYSNFYICSNGFITFTSGQSAFPSYGAALPSSGAQKNMIALAWNDWNPQNAGSQISYYTTGTAPNRKLVVSFNTSHFGGVAYPFVGQLILYETSNQIEFHVTNLVNPAPFDNAATTTQGVHNLTATKATSIPGRNGTLFSLTNDAYRFTPDTLYTYNWMPVAQSGDTLVHNPQSNTTYTVQVNDGTSCVQSVSSPLIYVFEPSASGSYNQPLFTYDTLKLQITPSGNVQAYNWSGPNSLNSNTQNVNIANVSTSINGVYTYTVTDALGCSKSNTMQVAITAAPVLNLKAFLAGPYQQSSGLMHDSLRLQNKIPLSEPYTALSSIFTHVNGGGNEQTNTSVLSVSGNNAAVDWVFVQLRSALDSSVVLATKSALIQKDGDIVDARNGVNPLSFTTLSVGNYFVSLKHRNHIGMMGAQAYALNESGNLIDFSNLSTSMYERSAPFQNLTPFTGAGKIVGTKRLLYSGNANIATTSNAYRFIKYNGLQNDRIGIISIAGATGVISGYLTEDLNMDGVVKYNGIANDRLLLLQALSGNVNSIIHEQTPN